MKMLLSSILLSICLFSCYDSAHNNIDKDDYLYIVSKSYIKSYLTNYYIQEYCEKLNTRNMNNDQLYEIFDIERNLEFDLNVDTLSSFKVELFSKYKFITYSVKLENKGNTKFVLAFDSLSRVLFLNGFDCNQFELLLQSSFKDIYSFQLANEITDFYCDHLVYVPGYLNPVKNENVNVDTLIKDGYYKMERKFYAPFLKTHFVYKFKVYTDKRLEVEETRMIN